MYNPDFAQNMSLELADTKVKNNTYTTNHQLGCPAPFNGAVDSYDWNDCTLPLRESKSPFSTSTSYELISLVVCTSDVVVWCVLAGMTKGVIPKLVAKIDLRAVDNLTGMLFSADFKVYKKMTTLKNPKV